MPDLAGEIEQREKAARELARLAGLSTLKLFHAADLRVSLKNDRSPVTEADRNAEQILRERILSDFPDDGVLGEELGEVRGENEFRWVLDPIDGTKSFIRGVPLFGTMVGLEHRGEAVAGVVYFPGLDEIVYATRGQGCWYSRAGETPREARVSTASHLAESTLLVTDPKGFGARSADDFLRRLENSVALSRSWGDCYGYYLVATGRAEIMIDPILQVWDAVAIQPIIEEAGGVFLDWSGARSTTSGSAIAANKQIMPQVLALMRG
jgi:histidinol phosphatase-like enzyme (inositol monophosphatase family)